MSDTTWVLFMPIRCPELASWKCQDIDELLSFLNMSFENFQHGDSSIQTGHQINSQFLGGSRMRAWWCLCSHAGYVAKEIGTGAAVVHVWRCELMKLKVWEDLPTLKRRGIEHKSIRQKSLCDGAIDDAASIKFRQIRDLYAHRVITLQFSSVDANPDLIARTPGSTCSYFGFGPIRLGRSQQVKDLSTWASALPKYEY